MLKQNEIGSVCVILALVGAQFPGALQADENDEGGGERRRAATFHVIGYLPNYRAADLDPEVCRHLTDLVYFSAEPDPAGDLRVTRINREHLQKLRKIKERHNVALSLCIGGAKRSSGFPKLAASGAARQRFAEAVTRFCIDNQFDGADLDWEHPSTDAEHRDYAALLGTLKTRFEPHRLQLTIAVAGWQALPAETINAVDRIHLMAYDNEGRHSTYEIAEADVARLLKKGIPPAKLCLGVPFYGRSLRDRSKVMTYAEIVRKFKPGMDVDETDGVYFNGVRTIERKTKFALANKLGGVMAWEIGQDTTDDSSLLGAIHRAAEEPPARR